MNKLKINIWGRDFELDIVYDCFQGEEILDVQMETLKCFLEKPDLIIQAKSAIEDYCVKHNGDDMDAKTIDNIFKYVIPISLYIQRTNDNSHVIGLMCKYKFNIDDGLAVMFKNEEIREVGSQNIIL